MATLYSQSASNIRKTWLLISGFLIFVIALGWIFSYAFNNPGILIFAAVISVLMSTGSYWWSDKIGRAHV